MAYVDEKTQKFIDNIINGASNEELFKVDKPKVIERDPMSEAIVSFAPAILGSLTGESGALAAPAASKQAREYYESNLKNQQEVANKAAEMANKQKEKALELNLKVDKEIADRDYKTQQLAQAALLNRENQNLRKDQIEAMRDTARERIAAANEARAARQSQEKNLPENVYQAATFSQRVEDANKQMEGLMSGGYDPTSIKQVLINKVSPEALKGNEAKLMEQAQRNFVNAILRRESGAAISPTEFESAGKQYFPQVGDSSDVIDQKQRNREVALAGLKTEGAKALERMQPNLPPQKTTQIQSNFTEEKAKRLAELRAKQQAGKLGQ